MMRAFAWHAFIIIGFIIGHIYLLSSSSWMDKGTSISFCPIKTTTGLPCPSCGSTRAIVHLYHGQPAEAISINPMGVFAILLIWILFGLSLYDLVMRKNQLTTFISALENWVSRRSIWPWVVLAVGANWVWNLTKGL